MPRILARAGIAVALLLAPTLALATADDVTLTTDAVISVNGVTLNVSGSGGSVESIIVNSTNFSVALRSGSTFEATKFMTAVVTPSTTLCTTAAATPTSGGGGGSYSSATSATPATPTVTTTPAVTPAVPATPAVPVTPAKSASGLPATQIQSLLT